jgi:hypothetical protein
MADPDADPAFRRGWEAALLAAKQWHEAQAKRCEALARRNRFPKTLEREAEFHREAAERITALSPDDV